jgi:tripartite-type tricarboxylate transporter receptor subunit TctC
VNRRQLLLASAAILAAARSASAQAWPTRPLRLVVPFAAGAGVLDIMGRITGQHLAEAAGQQVIVDNRPGAGGNVGADIVVKAAPDGYTMLMGNTAALVAPYLYAHMSFDPLVDLLPVTQVNSAPLMLIVHPSLPVKNVKEFIAYAREKKGALNYGSGGVGATPFLAVELMKSMAGFDAVHVPYKGGSPALAALVAGEISFMIENVPGSLPFVKDGKLRALAITSARRLPLVAELPTMQEAGVPGYEMVGWNGIYLPKGTPSEIVTKLHDLLATVLRSGAMKKQMADLGAEPVGNPQPEFAAFVKSESDRWGKIIREKGIKPE